MEGILPVWKEKGMTSFACVSYVRRLLGIKKVGHAGTLDPEVEGVLPIAIGPATRTLEFMLESDKTYIGEITLGYSTSTEDATGELIERVAMSDSDEENVDRVDKVLKEFHGEIEQIPPMYSAVRVNGRHLYEYAFEGIEIERTPRKVHIYNLERTSNLIYDIDEKVIRFSFEVTCSKGTYIRTLAVDIGKKLGYPAHMSKLTRIKSGKIEAKQTKTLTEIEEMVNNGTIKEVLLPLDYGLSQFSKIPITDDLWEKVKNGAILSKEAIQTGEFPVLLTYKDQAVALYDIYSKDENKLKPKKVFRTEVKV